MRRYLALAVVVGTAVALQGCLTTMQIPPKPTPMEIVQMNATAEMRREFKVKPALKQELPKFLEKLGEATTTAELREAWAAVYPDYDRVVNRAISKSLHDFYWPIMPVEDGRVYVEGFRAAAEQLVAVATPDQS